MSLEKYKSLYDINEQIIGKQDLEIKKYQTLTDNQLIIIKSNESIISEQDKINQTLKGEVARYKHKASKWPYWISGSLLIGGILGWQLTK